MLQRAGNFLLTILLGGLVVVLPIVVVIQVIRWLLGWLLGVLEPLTALSAGPLGELGLPPQVISVLAILAICFAVGLLVRTTAGRWLQRQIEHWFLAHIPGYEMLRDLFAQLNPGEKRSFSRPVLVSVGSTGRLYGFVTDEYADGSYAVFLPTSPSPLNGYVLQVTEAQLEFLDCNAEKVMQSVLGCGIGSGEIVGLAQQSNPGAAERLPR